MFVNVQPAEGGVVDIVVREVQHHRVSRKAGEAGEVEAGAVYYDGVGWLGVLATALESYIGISFSI